MKDVVGWEVGKWKGQPVYYNLADRFPIIHAEHYYLHAKEKDMERRLMEKNYHQFFTGCFVCTEHVLQ